MFCCTLLYVHFSIAIILIGKRELVALLNLSSCCLVMVEWLFLAVPWGCLRFVIVVFPDHIHYLDPSDKHVLLNIRLIEAVLLRTHILDVKQEKYFLITHFYLEAFKISLSLRKPRLEFHVKRLLDT